MRFTSIKKDLGKKGLSTTIIVILIFCLIVLFILVAFSGKINEWVNDIIDKLFGW